MGHDRLKKVVLVIFPQKSSFNTIMQFGPNMGQNYATLYPRQLYLMIHSLKILKCSMMGYNSQTKVLLVNLTKNFPFCLRAIWAQCGPNLRNLMSHDSLSEDLLKFCGIMRYRRQTTLVIFPKIFFWGNMGPIWNLLSYDLLFVDFFICCSMTVYSRYAMVTVNFAKVSLLGLNGQFGPNLGKNYATLFCNIDLDLRIVLDILE